MKKSHLDFILFCTTWRYTKNVIVLLSNLYQRFLLSVSQTLQYLLLVVVHKITLVPAAPLFASLLLLHKSEGLLTWRFVRSYSKYQAKTPSDTEAAEATQSSQLLSTIPSLQFLMAGNVSLYHCLVVHANVQKRNEDPTAPPNPAAVKDRGSGFQIHEVQYCFFCFSSVCYK